ncbi:TlpA family protein disulfide reductase [Halopiger xanaduensis]|uniref:Alkyl hydroperoxide reductase/thiol specific antioxidant/Mal allergen n=1 Tax=Halopiger xanaduensis (strain DSM 18323 / JCM 14033 / SH-6) TaxID=797210 RepID=F8DBM3_HALXS|nr:redoxin domain-containing protein [Halopiger xanaduensis]AEH38290.1 alkyl hydroperoxide reductase/thiol specific antioxidant/Mal allergen [Halopiger xanaduensis SH-6]
MKRREVVAGIASVGVLGTGVAVLQRGLPFGDGGPAQETAGDGDDGGIEPIEVDVLEDARGDAPDALSVPNDGVTLAMIFSPVCSRCRALMPELEAAREELRADYGDALTVLSVTAEQTPDRLRDWWAENDGEWVLGYDPDRRLGERYDVVGHPMLLAIDDAGELHWDNRGRLEAGQIVEQVAPVLEAHADANGETE